MNDGIRLGDISTIAVDPKAGDISVCLNVVEIRLYGHLMDEVTRNMGFHLCVTGDEIGLLGPAVQHYGLAPGSYVHS